MLGVGGVLEKLLQQHVALGESEAGRSHGSGPRLPVHAEAGSGELQLGAIAGPASLRRSRLIVSGMVKGERQTPPKPPRRPRAMAVLPLWVESTPCQDRAGIFLRLPVIAAPIPGISRESRVASLQFWPSTRALLLCHHPVLSFEPVGVRPMAEAAVPAKIVVIGWIPGIKRGKTIFSDFDS